MKNTENIEFKTVARRYSKALRELCEAGSVDKNFVLNDLKAVVETLKSSEELVNLMKTPGVSKSEKQNVIKKIFNEKVNHVTENFLLYLIEKDRFDIVESVYSEFKSEIDKDNNFVEIEIVSAIDLDESTKKIITDKLSEKLNKKLNVDWSVDSDIIGGLVFVVGDSIIDTSIKSKLQMIGRNIIK